MKVEYHPDTVDEIDGAVAYFEEKDEGLGEDFLIEIEKAFLRIEHLPKSFPSVKGEIRRCFVKRFPYSVLFRAVDEDTVRILAIRHHRQRESYGTRRI